MTSSAQTTTQRKIRKSTHAKSRWDSTGLTECAHIMYTKYRQVNTYVYIYIIYLRTKVVFVYIYI